MILSIYLNWERQRVVGNRRMANLHHQNQRTARHLHLQVWKGVMTRLLKRRKAPVSRTYLSETCVIGSLGSDCAISRLPQRSSFNRRSLQLTKTLTHSMGGYLPNSLTEMWEPSRDFAFLRLPTTGTRSIVAFSG